ncbi:LysR family transcriptional regulator [Streptomyces specialis]|uniref:LysR family transcriptional regulator n=1 Tax=Streptomyces specialis TaxID=498367 RepID=UPI00073FA22C|nr:LysR family transcriptional regulator [Streptomyces specialis]
MGAAVGATQAGLTLHQLRLFLALAEERHFGRAAVRMCLSQSALSRQIQAMERHLGVALLDRTSRSVELAPAGELLLPEVRTVVDAADRLLRTAREQGRATGGRVILGTIGAEAAMPYTHATLRRLRAASPDLQVEIRLLSLAEHFGALENGEVDVVFCRPPAPPGIQLQHLASEPRVVCLAADDPLADRTHLTLADLADRPVVSLPPETPRVWREFWTAVPRSEGRPVRPGPVVMDLEALMLAVATGQAIAFLPAAARLHFPRPGVAYAEVTDLSPCTAALAWAERNGSSPAVVAVRRAAQQATGPGGVGGHGALNAGER